VVRLGALVCLIALIVTGCTSGHPSRGASTTPTARPTSGSASVAALGRPGCEPATPITRNGGLPEVEGTSSQIQLWGLLMAAGSIDPLRVNEDVKIVWRITGSGDVAMTSVDPAGHTHALEWGPDLHSSSNYDRPGQEWGAGYLFTQPGCWRLHAVRGSATADVWVQVAG
jgi:hypothetical protein